MKSNLILSSILGLMFFGMLTSPMLNMNIKPAKHKIKMVQTEATNTGKAPKCSCVAQVTDFTIVHDIGGYITFSWSYTGNPASFNYGGYYNPGGTFGTVNTTSTTVTIPDNGVGGGRIGVLAICADGSSSGTTHGVLWYDYKAEEYF